MDTKTSLREIAQEIFNRRAARRMTQTDLANASGVPQATISRYERDPNMMNSATLAAIARALGCTLAELAPSLTSRVVQPDGVPPEFRAGPNPRVSAVVANDPQFAALADMWKKLTDDQKRRIMQIAYEPPTDKTGPV